MFVILILFCPTVLSSNIFVVYFLAKQEHSEPTGGEDKYNDEMEVSKSMLPTNQGVITSSLFASVILKTLIFGLSTTTDGQGGKGAWARQR